jgi:hypothetical protein
VRHKEPLFYTAVVVVLTGLALCVNEGFLGRYKVRLLNNDYCINTYPAVWELFALIATLVLLAAYCLSLKNLRTVKRDSDFLVPVIALPLAAICLVLALLTLTKISWHFGFVIAVAFLFGLGDLFIWRGIDAQAEPVRAWAAQSYLFFADVPVLFGLVVLGLYYYGFHRQGPMDAAEYFLGGAIAFQWLASNVIFVVVSWCAFVWSKSK